MNSTKVTCISQFDTKGSLPQWVVNVITSSKSQKVLLLKDIAEKKLPNKDKKRSHDNNRDSNRDSTDSFERLNASTSWSL